MSQVLRKRLVSGGISSILGRGLGIAAQSLFTILLARLLSPNDFGIWCWLVSLLSVASVVMLAGAEEIIIRQTAVGAANRRRISLRILGAVVGLSTTTVAALCFLGLPWLRPEFGETGSWVTRLAFIGVLVSHVGQRLIGASLRGLHHLLKANLFTGRFGGPLGACCFLLLLMPALNHSPVELATALVLNALGFAICIPLGLYWVIQAYGAHSAPNSEGTVSGIITATGIASLLAMCMPVMLAEIFGTIAQNGDVWIVGCMQNADELSLYTGARRVLLLLTTPFTLAGLTIMSSIPELHANGDKKQLQLVFQSSAASAVLPAILVMLPLIVFPSQILSLILGPAYSGGSALLVVFASGQIIRAFAGHCMMGLVMTGNARIAMIINATASALIVITSYLASSYSTLNGVAICWAGISVGQSLASLFALRVTAGVWSFAAPRQLLSIGRSRRRMS